MVAMSWRATVRASSGICSGELEVSAYCWFISKNISDEHGEVNELSKDSGIADTVLYTDGGCHGNPGPGGKLGPSPG